MCWSDMRVLSAGVLGAAGCWSAQLMELRVLEGSWVQVVAQVMVLRVLGCSWVLRVVVQLVVQLVAQLVVQLADGIL